MLVRTLLKTDAGERFIPNDCMFTHGWINDLFLFQSTVLDACAQIRDRLSEIKGLGHPNQYGLFQHDEDPKKGFWLEPGRTLDHYLLRDNVSSARR